MKKIYPDPKLPDWKKEVDDIFELHKGSAFTNKDWPYNCIVEWIPELITEVRRFEECRIEKYIAGLNATELKQLHKRLKFRHNPKVPTRN